MGEKIASLNWAAKFCVVWTTGSRLRLSARLLLNVLVAYLILPPTLRFWICLKPNLISVLWVTSLFEVCWNTQLEFCGVD